MGRIGLVIVLGVLGFVTLLVLVYRAGYTSGYRQALDKAFDQQVRNRASLPSRDDDPKIVR